MVPVLPDMPSSVALGPILYKIDFIALDVPALIVLRTLANLLE